MSYKPIVLLLQIYSNLSAFENHNNFKRYFIQGEGGSITNSTETEVLIPMSINIVDIVFK